MIFSHTLDQVLSGRKSQTRRLAKLGEVLDESGWRVLRQGRTVYAVGKTYAVQPQRAKPSVARIRLMSLRREAVNAISEADAHAEGFESREEFLHTWHAIHGQNADLNREVWVLEFELAE